MQGSTYRGFLVLADISGYTRFMLHNRETMVHGQLIINELLKSVLEEVHGLFSISKLEGDAVFMYCFPAGNPNYCPKVLYSTLRALPQVFERKKKFLEASNICHCQACVNIESLKLKVFTHFGEVLMTNLKNFNELSGVDVILVHRLMKNDVKLSEYILMTDMALDELDPPDQESFDKQVFKDDDLDSLNINILDFEGLKVPLAKVSRFIKLKLELYKLISTMLVFLGLKKLNKLTKL